MSKPPSNDVVLKKETETANSARLPLSGWGLELARRWNGGTYSLFILHGNIFDLFPFQENGSLQYG